MGCKFFNDCFTCPYEDCILDETKIKISHRTKEQYERKLALEKERQKKRKEQGLCVKCGRKLQDDKYTKCIECRIKAARYNKKYRDMKALRGETKTKEMLDGINLCKKCGKAKPAEGYNICERCLEQCRRALSKIKTHKRRGEMTSENNIGNSKGYS